MKIYKLKQCVLQKGNVHQTSWIPTKYAKIGKVLKLKGDNGWDNGWVVKNTYSEISSDMLLNLETLPKRHRKHSDI